MDPNQSAADLVARLNHRIDEISGLITLSASQGKVSALVASSAELRTVERELLALGVPSGMLQLQVVSETLIPFPPADRRLERWLEEVAESGEMDVALTVKGPRLGMTPRRIGRIVLGLVIASFLLSILAFILLMIIER
jgi:hypothetical protein